MPSLISVAALLFVIGVVLMAVGSPPLPRVAWILWAVAAILWYVVSYVRT